MKRKMSVMREANGILHKCQLCVYSTPRKCNLDRHIKLIHKPCKPKVCCNLIFNIKYDLIVHKVNAHKTGYRCEVCAQNFKRNKVLERHMSVHTGVKPYKCRYCWYRSSNRCNVKRHEGRVHRITQPSQSQSQPSQSQPSQSQPSQPRPTRLCVYPYKCLKCNAKFASQIEIETHTSTLNGRLKCEQKVDELSVADILLEFSENMTL